MTLYLRARSSVAERTAHNRLVVGSIPTGPIFHAPIHLSAFFNAEPFCRWRFHTIDDFDVLRKARNQPEVLLSGTDCVVTDEVQKISDLTQPS